MGPNQVVDAEVVRLAARVPNILHVVYQATNLALGTHAEPPSEDVGRGVGFQIQGCDFTWPGTTRSPSSLTETASLWQQHLLEGLAGDVVGFRRRLDQLISRTTEAASPDPVELVEMLWQRYWILDEGLAGALAVSMTPRAVLSERAIATIKQQKRILREAQGTAATPHEWATACFRALPSITFADLALRRSTSASDQSYARMADEMRVDVRHSLYRVAGAALDSSRPLFTQTGDRAEHAWRARFELPKRWNTMAGPSTRAERQSLLAMLVPVIHRAGWSKGSVDFRGIELGLVTDRSVISSGWRTAPLVAEARADRLPTGLHGVSRTKLGHVKTERTDRVIRRRAPILEATRALERERALSRREANVHRVLFVAQLLSAASWLSVARRQLPGDAWEITQSLTPPGPDRKLAMWLFDRDATYRPTCEHAECQFGPMFLGPRVRRGVTKRSLVTNIADVVADWLGQPRPYDVVFDVEGIVVQIEDRRGRLTTEELDLQRA